MHGTKKHHTYLFEPEENGSSGESRNFLHQSDIVSGTPDADTLLTCENLRWIQINSAGYAAYDREDLKKKLIERQTILTNSSAVYVEPCSQHLLAMILSFARALPFAYDGQRETHSWQKKRFTAEITSSQRTNRTNFRLRHDRQKNCRTAQAFSNEFDRNQKNRSRR
jgi:phosphoglycerate dehydrogenase-like enzyme